MEYVRLRVKRTYRREMSKYHKSGEGRWSEKLITFTVPHSEYGPKHDTKILVSGWQMVLRKLRRHLARRGVPDKGRVPWLRAVEVSASGSGGHSHLHVWFTGPYVEVVLLRAWWGQVLAGIGVGGIPERSVSDACAEGRDRRTTRWLLDSGIGRDGMVPWPVVHIMSGGASTGAYAAKVGIANYVVKSDGALEMVSPAHATKAYEALEGVRVVQWARGWAPPKNASPYVWWLRPASEEERRRFNGGEEKSVPGQFDDLNWPGLCKEDVDTS